jgi:LacI family transcriptional regulator
MAMVAQRAGVSTMTVSNVINGRQTTAEPTRQLVLEAIRELGYRPNAAAQRWPARSSRISDCSITMRRTALSARC